MNEQMINLYMFIEDVLNSGFIIWPSSWKMVGSKAENTSSLWVTQTQNPSSTFNEIIEIIKLNNI